MSDVHNILLMCLFYILKEIWLLWMKYNRQLLSKHTLKNNHTTVGIELSKSSFIFLAEFNSCYELNWNEDWERHRLGRILLRLRRYISAIYHSAAIHIPSASQYGGWAVDWRRCHILISQNLTILYQQAQQTLQECFKGILPL